VLGDKLSDREAGMSVDYFEEQRREMVAAIRAITDHIATQISKSTLDKRVLGALAKVPRHEFVPVEVQQYAYLNSPLPIGFDKTISQPLMVAVMTDLLELKPNDVVLEIGTGLGYQAAVLAAGQRKLGEADGERRGHQRVYRFHQFAPSMTFCFKRGQPPSWKSRGWLRPYFGYPATDRRRRQLPSQFIPAAPSLPGEHLRKEDPGGYLGHGAIERLPVDNVVKASQKGEASLRF
jgi:Protein-L-isoaspartate(D-aspartate) O-methyltransferase (PCMT)